MSIFSSPARRGWAVAACIAVIAGCSGGTGPASSEGQTTAGSGTNGSNVAAGSASGGAAGSAGAAAATSGAATEQGGSIAGGAAAANGGGGAAGGGAAGAAGAMTGGAAASGGGSAPNGGAGASPGGGAGAGGSPNAGAFAISSSEHADGAVFSDQFTCAGEGKSPPLSWTAGPAGTKSYAITFLDETLVAQNNANGYHYVIWDIPSDTLALPAALPAGAALTTPVMAKQNSPQNGFDHFPANAYFGPCPNAVGSGNTDTYAFTLYALPVASLTGTLNGVKNIEAAIKAAGPLATSKLSGKSSAKPN